MWQRRDFYSSRERESEQTRMLACIDYKIYSHKAKTHLLWHGMVIKRNE
jgi:hypothetical protein